MAILTDLDMAKAFQTPCPESPFKLGYYQIKEIR